MYILYETVNEKSYITTGCTDLSSVDDTLKSKFIEVSEPPTPQILVGKTARLLVNLTTNQLYYEYEDRPLTSEEQIAELQTDNANINYALMMGGLI